MNIVHQSTERLELEHQPTNWMIGLGALAAVLLLGVIKALADGAFGGAAVAAVMLAAIAWVALTQVFRRVSLVADRGSGTLTVTAASYLDEQTTEHALTDVVRAEVEARYSTTDSSTEPGLVLVLGGAERPDRLRLDLFRPDPADLLQAEQCINGWLGHTPESSRAEPLHPSPGEPAV